VLCTGGVGVLCEVWVIPAVVVGNLFPLFLCAPHSLRDAPDDYAATVLAFISRGPMF
jgi:hypothetical protein